MITFVYTTWVQYSQVIAILKLWGRKHSLQFDGSNNYVVSFYGKDIQPFLLFDLLVTG